MPRTVLSLVVLCAAALAAPPPSIVFCSATEDGAAFRAGAFLGEFKRIGSFGDRPLYRQLDTEGEQDIFLYYSSGAWWVGYDTRFNEQNIPSEQSALRNPSDSLSVPFSGWPYSLLGDWVDDDPTLQLVAGRLVPCPRLTVASSDFEQDVSVIDSYTPSGRWSEGRPVYRYPSNLDVMAALSISSFTDKSKGQTSFWCGIHSGLSSPGPAEMRRRRRITGTLMLAPTPR